MAYGRELEHRWKCCNCDENLISTRYGEETEPCFWCGHSKCDDCTDFGLAKSADAGQQADSYQKVSSAGFSKEDSTAANSSRSRAQPEYLNSCRGMEEATASGKLGTPTDEHKVFPSHPEENQMSKFQASIVHASVPGITDTESSKSSKALGPEIPEESQEVARQILEYSVSRIPNLSIIVDSKRLLDDFSVDLQNEALPSEKERASRIVEHLAQIPAHLFQSELLAEGIRDSSASVPNLGGSEGQALGDELAEVRNLILGSQALRSLRDKIKTQAEMSSARNDDDQDAEEDLMESSTPSENVSKYRDVALFSSLLAWTRSNMTNSIPSGMKRIQWTCVS